MAITLGENGYCTVEDISAITGENYPENSDAEEVIEGLITDGFGDVNRRCNAISLQTPFVASSSPRAMRQAKLLNRLWVLAHRNQTMGNYDDFTLLMREYREYFKENDWGMTLFPDGVKALPSTHTGDLRNTAISIDRSDSDILEDY